MVALQFLDLPVKVRVLVRQQTTQIPDNLVYQGFFVTNLAKNTPLINHPPETRV